MAAALALAVGAGGCGAEFSSSSTSTSTAATPVKARSDAAGKGGTAAKEAAGENTIQGYGAAAGGDDKAAVAAAVHDFLTAMAAGDDARLCADLAASNREQLEAFGEGEGSSADGCAAALKKLLNPSVADEARAAAAAPVTSVRIKGDTAFALYTPKGRSANYLVMKREGDSWKAISVTPGTPLDPTATP